MNKRGGKKFCFRLGDLAKAKGISKWSVAFDIKKGRLKPRKPVDVCRWLREPRGRITKGKPIPWLEGKRGRKKKY